MSDVTVETDSVKVLVPKGYKRCPKCKRLVKGPRTKICTHEDCKAEFPQKGKTKARVVKAKKGGKPGRPRKVVAVAATDPYTFNEVVNPNYNGFLSGVVIRKAAAILNTPVNDAKAAAFAASITPAEHTPFENVEVYA